MSYVPCCSWLCRFLFSLVDQAFTLRGREGWRECTLTRADPSGSRGLSAGLAKSACACRRLSVGRDLRVRRGLLGCRPRERRAPADLPPPFPLVGSSSRLPFSLYILFFFASSRRHRRRLTLAGSARFMQIRRRCPRRRSLHHERAAIADTAETRFRRGSRGGQILYK